MAQESTREQPTGARNAFGDIAPKLAEITDRVLFGDVWEDPALSPRDRSLVTIVNLAALYRQNELPFRSLRAIRRAPQASSAPSSPLRRRWRK